MITSRGGWLGGKRSHYKRLDSAPVVRIPLGDDLYGNAMPTSFQKNGVWCGMSCYKLSMDCDMILPKLGSEK